MATIPAQKVAKLAPPPLVSVFAPSYDEACIAGLFSTTLVLGALIARVFEIEPNVPSVFYFAQKHNVLNVHFVKKGWLWATITVSAIIFTRNAQGPRAFTQKVQSVLRWGAVTAWWFLMTQWFFGAAIIDRGFILSGGGCRNGEGFSAMTCKRAGGQWSGGHDLSGHIFMLVMSSGMILEEVFGVRGGSLLGSDGRVLDAAKLEKSTPLTLAERAGLGVVGINMFMVLMTSIFYHTWAEKIAGLATALTALYTVYVLPRWVPTARRIWGLPGIE